MQKTKLQLNMGGMKSIEYLLRVLVSVIITVITLGLLFPLLIIEIVKPIIDNIELIYEEDKQSEKNE